MTTQLEQAWELAKLRFAAVGIDVEAALRQLDRLPVSMHCWQGDDVAGFENPEGSLTGGIQATGNYPGKARNATELRAKLSTKKGFVWVKREITPKQQAEVHRLGIPGIGFLPDHKRVYILSHTSTDDFGKTKIKTVGKLLDEKIVLEGLVTIVLRTGVQNGKYLFSTQNSGADTVKSPIGLFDDELIDNDLAAADAAIFNYYGLQEAA